MAEKIEGYICQKCGHIEKNDFKKCSSCKFPYDNTVSWTLKGENYEDGIN